MIEERSEKGIKEVYARAGHALYWAQCFEQSLVIYLLLYGRVSGNISTTEQQDYLYADADTKTMGQLLRKVKELTDFDSRTNSVITEALRKRNQFAHRFFKEHDVAFLSDTGRNNMITILKEHSNLFQEADDIMTAVNLTIAKQLGISEELLDTEFAKMQEEANKI